MWFILSAAISTICSVFLTKFVTLLSDDFVSLLRAPNQPAAAKFEAEARPQSEPQMTVICLFVTGCFFSTFVQNNWLTLSFATGIIGAVALLAFICLLAIGVRAAQWIEYGITRFYRNTLNSLNIIDRAYAFAKSVVK